MSPDDLTEEETLRAIRIFMYESSGRSSPYWTSPHLYVQKMQQVDASAELFVKAYNEWFTTKRAFQQAEILEGVWIKIGDDGNSVVIRLFPDGRLEQASLFKPQRYGQGFWLLENGVLRIGAGEYECDILASREDTLHSGIEFKRGQSNPKAYVKFIHQEKMLKQNLSYNPDNMVYEGVTSLGRRIAVSIDAFHLIKRDSIKKNLPLPLEAYDPDWWEVQMPVKHVWYVNF